MEKKTKYAVFNYSKQDQDLIDSQEEYINEHVEEIYEFFDSTLPRTKVIINIIPTKKEFDEYVKELKHITEVPAWVIGNYGNNTISYVSLHDYKNTSHAFPPEKYDENLENYKKTIIHEYVHFVVGLYLTKNKCDEPARYLNEGIAQYLSHQKEGMKLVFTHPLEDVLNNNNNNNNCYSDWFLLTKYIIEEKGKEYFLTLLKDRKRTMSEIPKIFEEAKTFYEKLN